VWDTKKQSAVWDLKVRKEELDGQKVYVLHHFLSSEECRLFIRASEALGYEEAPLSSPYGAVMDKSVRDNARVMADDPVLAARLWERARLFVSPATDGWQAVGFNERFRYYRYEGAERFAPHYDGSFRRENGEESRLTFLVYLNDVAAGGETNFLGPDCLPRIGVQPEAGKALVFLHRQLHEAVPVLAGRKYVLRTDVMYRCPGTAAARRGRQ
jgi:hypothetical protein